MISPLAGITPNKPAHASLPLPGIQPVIVDSDGKELSGNNVEGNMCIKFPTNNTVNMLSNTIIFLSNKFFCC